MIANAVMLIFTSALVGFKFALITKMTGNIFMAMGDHFVNNTIVNLLHLLSESGADELMSVRVAIAQTLSFCGSGQRQRFKSKANLVYSFFHAAAR